MSFGEGRPSGDCFSPTIVGGRTVRPVLSGESCPGFWPVVFCAEALPAHRTKHTIAVAMRISFLRCGEIATNGGSGRSLGARETEITVGERSRWAGWHFANSPIVANCHRGEASCQSLWPSFSLGATKGPVLEAQLHELAHILLIEDNEDDYEALRRSFVKSRFANPLTWCRNAEHALRMLRRDESYADKAPPRPDLILLDLNMPGMDGRGFLELIKADERLRSIPVVVLSTSADAVDINRCYQFGASTYIHKPVTFEGLIKAVRALKDYWFSVALRPI